MENNHTIHITYQIIAITKHNTNTTAYSKWCKSLEIVSVTLSRETNRLCFPFLYPFICLLNDLDCRVAKRTFPTQFHWIWTRVSQHVTIDEVRGGIWTHSSPCSTSQQKQITLNRCLCRASSICLCVKEWKFGTAAVGYCIMRWQDTQKMTNWGNKRRRMGLLKLHKPITREKHFSILFLYPDGNIQNT